MAITLIPEVQLRIEANGRYRVMAKNPNKDVASASSLEAINGMRIYSAVARSEDWSAVGDLDVPFSSDAEYLELFFTPGDLGVFSFSWLRLDPDATPIPIEEEGTRSAAAPFVYGAISTLSSVFLAQDCFEGTAITAEALFQANEFASREFDQYTDNFFYPVYQTLRANGRGANDLLLPYTIIQVIELSRVIPSDQRGATLIDPSDYVVYNRHMRDRKAFDSDFRTRVDGALEYPGDGSGGPIYNQDRRSPRVSFTFPNEVAAGNRHYASGLIWSRNQRIHPLGRKADGFGFTTGRQNIMVKGFYGFTEGDLSVPGGVVVATERLALRRATLLYGDLDDVERVLRGHKVTMEKTDVHMIMYESKDRLAGFFTGENIIDGWIAHYARTAGGGFV